MTDIMADTHSEESHPLIHRDFKCIHSDSKCVGKAVKPFRVLQYNILADALSYSTPEKNFCKVPPTCLVWPFRSNQLLKQILSFDADIICLEEVDHFHDFFVPGLSGYEGSFSHKKDSPCLTVKNNNGPDGSALFFKKGKYIRKKTVHEYLIDEDGKEGKNPILVNVLEEIDSKAFLVVGVTHLKAKKGFENRRKAQSESAIDILKGIAISYDDASIILCGDFNGEPDEVFYKAMIDAGFKSAFVDALGKEPEYTTWKIRPSGEERHSIDYIWQHEAHKYDIAGVFTLMCDDLVPAERFPSFGQPSDHIPLCFEFSRN